MKFTSFRRRLAIHDTRVLIVAAVAVALMLIGVLLRSRPIDWSRRLGDLLPGWPWW